MYIDVNGDGVSTADDVLTPATTAVDFWLDTDSNADGTPAICNDNPADNLTINSYEIIVRATGAMTYGGWSDNLGYTVILGDANAGADFYVGRGSGTISPPGLYKLGTLALSGVAANSVLSIVTSTSAAPLAFTDFGTACFGIDFDNTYKLGSDWTDAQGTYPPTPVTKSTWGKIKDLYR
jgi:hypothetical protein